MPGFRVHTLVPFELGSGDIFSPEGVVVELSFPRAWCGGALSLSRPLFFLGSVVVVHFMFFSYPEICFVRRLSHYLVWFDRVFWCALYLYKAGETQFRKKKQYVASCHFIFFVAVELAVNQENVKPRTPNPI